MFSERPRSVALCDHHHNSEGSSDSTSIAISLSGSCLSWGRPRVGDQPTRAACISYSVQMIPALLQKARGAEDFQACILEPRGMARDGLELL